MKRLSNIITLLIKSFIELKKDWMNESKTEAKKERMSRKKKRKNEAINERKGERKKGEKEIKKKIELIFKTKKRRKVSGVCLFVWVLWHINHCRLFFAESLFIQIRSYNSNNSV